MSHDPIEDTADAAATELGEARLKQLFEKATPRPQPPAETERFIRQALFDEWDAVTRTRIRRRRAGWLAAAASVVVALGALFVFGTTERLPPPGPILAAQVDRVTGDVRVEDADGETWRIVEMPATRLYVGQTLATSESGQVAIRLAGGGGLRLHHASRIRLDANGEVSLEEGLLYFDSRGGTGNGGHVTVNTPLGVVRDVGTQFIVQVTGTALEVGVREGRIDLERDGKNFSADSGERLTAPRGGTVRRESDSGFGPDWEWAERVSPMYPTDGSRILPFLKWVARETGRELIFDSQDARRIATERSLTGSPNARDPMSVLGLMLPTTKLTHRLEEGAIHIFVHDAAGDEN